MSKPTPGPWKTKRAEIPIDGEYDYAIYDEHKQVIAEAFGRTSVSNRPNAEANAHLIAAAPEMKDALLKIRASLAINQSALAVAIIATCDAAIAKAEGR